MKTTQIKDALNETLSQAAGILTKEEIIKNHQRRNIKEFFSSVGFTLLPDLTTRME